jgi:hypothetical protein
MKKHVSAPGTFLIPWKSHPSLLAKTMCPNVLVFVHLHKVLIFKDVACVVVNDGPNEMNGEVRGWGDCFQEDAFSHECISAMKQRWMSAK